MASVNVKLPAVPETQLSVLCSCVDDTVKTEAEAGGARNPFYFPV